jgi:uncharacterized protein (DUF4415 family)
MKERIDFMKPTLIKSNLTKVNSHIIQPNEYDDAPELNNDFFEHADAYVGSKLVRRGRPAGSSKVSTTIRFDDDVLEAFRAMGKGWQSKMNAVLREYVEKH